MSRNQSRRWVGWITRADSFGGPRVWRQSDEAQYSWPGNGDGWKLGLQHRSNESNATDGTVVRREGRQGRGHVSAAYNRVVSVLSLMNIQLSLVSAAVTTVPLLRFLTSF